jgi:hypothetical protein
MKRLRTKLLSAGVVGERISDLKTRLGQSKNLK